MYTINHCSKGYTKSERATERAGEKKKTETYFDRKNMLHEQQPEQSNI